MLVCYRTLCSRINSVTPELIHLFFITPTASPHPTGRPCHGLRRGPSLRPIRGPLVPPTSAGPGAARADAGSPHGRHQLQQEDEAGTAPALGVGREAEGERGEGEWDGGEHVGIWWMVSGKLGVKKEEDAGGEK